MSQVDKEADPAELKKHKRSLAEWVTFSIATSILSAIVGLVLYDWVTQKNDPPVLAVTRSGKIRQEQGRYYIPFSVTNQGGETAESVQVIAELRLNGNVEEMGEQQIDFLSGGETEEGAFIFDRPPDKGEVKIRVASYKLP